MYSSGYLSGHPSGFISVYEFRLLLLQLKTGSTLFVNFEFVLCLASTFGSCFVIEDPPGGSTAASPFERVRSWKERAVGISGVLGVPGVSGVRGVPGAFVMKHFGRNGN